MTRKNQQGFDLRISIEKSVMVARQRIINILKEVEVPMTKTQIKRDGYIIDKRGMNIFSLAIDYMQRNNEIKIIQINKVFYYILTENLDEDSIGALKIVLLNMHQGKTFHHYNFTDAEIKFIIENKDIKLSELTKLFNSIFRSEPPSSISASVLTGLKQRIKHGTAKKIITRKEFDELGSEKLCYEWSEIKSNDKR